MRRRSFLIGGAAAATAAGAVGVASVIDATTRPSTSSAATVDDRAADTRSFAAVTRGDLTAEREFRAAVSFGDAWALTTAASGTITGSHPVGTVVHFGEVLIRVDDQPVTLAQGAMPFYRTLEKIDTRGRDENGDRLALLTGLDVAQLQHFLVDAGHDAGGTMTVDGTFGSSTEKAVEAWQREVGVSPTGRVDSTRVVFSPEPVRIATATRVGNAFSALEVNHAVPAVLVDTSNRDRSAFTVGHDVRVELPNEPEASGAVEKQEQVAAGDGSTVWRTTIVLAGEVPGDASSATVTTLSTIATNVTIVPVGALLALAEGGFALEVESGATTRLVAVEVGEVLDGSAEVRGDVTAGDQVVIAG